MLRVSVKYRLDEGVHSAKPMRRGAPAEARTQRSHEKGITCREIHGIRGDRGWLSGLWTYLGQTGAGKMDCAPSSCYRRPDLADEIRWLGVQAHKGGQGNCGMNHLVNC